MNFAAVRKHGVELGSGFPAVEDLAKS
jgi:hypothetical protein